MTDGGTDAGRAGRVDTEESGANLATISREQLALTACLPLPFLTVFPPPSSLASTLPRGRE